MSEEKIIKAAVEWWAERIKGNTIHDNGDTGFQSFMAMRMADQGQVKATKEQIEIFKNSLSEQLKGKIGGRDTFLSCNYGPCKELLLAAEAAGINKLNFPFKTSMAIKNKGIRVSDGYAQPYVELEFEEKGKKIKQYPNDPTCFMYWDVATNDANCFWVREEHPTWQWNGDYERPTVSPSIKNDRPGFVNHVFIRDGKIEYLSDCTHEYAGKTVDMVDFPEEW